MQKYMYYKEKHVRFIGCYQGGCSSSTCWGNQILVHVLSTVCKTKSRYKYP